MSSAAWPIWAGSRPTCVPRCAVDDSHEHADEFGDAIGSAETQHVGRAGRGAATLVGGAKSECFVDSGMQGRVVPWWQRARQRLVGGVDDGLFEVDQYGHVGSRQQGERCREHTVLEHAGRAGRPRGRPSGNSQCSMRGGRARSTWPRTLLIPTVARPAASSTWASALTVRVHKGQTGVSSTTSTPSAFNSSAAAGPVSSRNVVRVWSGWAPMNDRCCEATDPITPVSASSASRSTG